MVRLLLSQYANYESMPLAFGLFISVSALVALCAKHGRIVSQKHNKPDQIITSVHKSPLASPRKIATNISNKAIPFVSKKMYVDGDDRDPEAENGGNIGDPGFGEGGLWQKSIILGEKCRPPKFSGVIYYDSYGNQVPEMPRSPRAASPLPSFSFPTVLKQTN